MILSRTLSLIAVVIEAYEERVKKDKLNEILSKDYRSLNEEEIEYLHNKEYRLTNKDITSLDNINDLLCNSNPYTVDDSEKVFKYLKRTHNLMNNEGRARDIIETVANSR